MASRFRQVSGKNGGAMGELDGENKVTGARDGVVMVWWDSSHSRL